MKLNKLAAAVALVAGAAAATPALAAINLDGLQLGGAFGGNAFNTDGGLGELFVSIVARDPLNSLNDRSYVRDLGLTTGSFLQGPVAPFTLAADATLTSFLSSNAGKELSFLVMGVHNSGVVDFDTFMTQNLGFLTTSGVSAAAVAAAQPQGAGGFQVSGAEVEFRSFVQGVNTKTDGSPVGNVATNLSTTFTPGVAGFHDLNFGRDQTFGFNTEGTLTGGLASTVDFFFLGVDNLDNSVTAAPRLMGTFSLAANGDLSYAPVPVPAAAWLMGSALAGLAGVARRRRAK